MRVPTQWYTARPAVSSRGNSFFVANSHLSGDLISEHASAMVIRPTSLIVHVNCPAASSPLGLCPERFGLIRCLLRLLWGCGEYEDLQGDWD